MTQDGAAGRALMFQGTGSDVGKSLVVAGLCRALSNRGLSVLPFKPQNMSNNAAVTSDGGEIGRAQALQAVACRVPTTVHMNPVLLKPQTETGAQVIVQGKVTATAKARDYHALKPKLMGAVLDSFERMKAQADIVLVEGAGSPAEINLRASDIANMGFAEAAEVPVVLVGDIDRGGVIAQLVGTWHLLTEAEQARTIGYMVNKFRGDPTLFDGGHQAIIERTDMANFGLIPFFGDARLLPPEDAFSVDNRSAGSSSGGTLHVAMPRLQRVANLDDLDPLVSEDNVRVTVVPPGDPLPGDADVVLIPGSKATLSDLADFRAQGWDIDLMAHHRRGGLTVGLCGGYQMLGRIVSDPDGIEGPAGSAPGLGLLDVETTLGGEKTLIPFEGRDRVFDQTVTGYEIHIGQTSGPDCGRPWLTSGGQNEGARSTDGRVMGAYVHGVFGAGGFRQAFLSAIREGDYAATAQDAITERVLDALADHLEQHVAIDKLFAGAA